MRIKLDENLGRRCVALLRDSGHDVATVVEQRLVGTDDRRLIEICAGEGRCLLTLDLDFANPIRFPPANFAGIAVIRLPAKPDFDDLTRSVQTFATAIAADSIQGKLWIIEIGRVRIFRPDRESDESP